MGHPVFQPLPSAVDVAAMRLIQGALSSLAQQGDGLPGWAIPLVLIAVIAVILAIFALTRRRID